MLRGLDAVDLEGVVDNRIFLASFPYAFHFQTSKILWLRVRIIITFFSGKTNYSCTNPVPSFAPTPASLFHEIGTAKQSIVALEGGANGKKHCTRFSCHSHLLHTFCCKTTDSSSPAQLSNLLTRPKQPISQSTHSLKLM